MTAPVPAGVKEYQTVLKSEAAAVPPSKQVLGSEGSAGFVGTLVGVPSAASRGVAAAVFIASEYPEVIARMGSTTVGDEIESLANVLVITGIESVPAELLAPVELSTTETRKLLCTAIKSWVRLLVGGVPDGASGLMSLGNPGTLISTDGKGEERGLLPESASISQRTVFVSANCIGVG